MPIRICLMKTIFLSFPGGWCLREREPQGDIISKGDLLLGGGATQPEVVPRPSCTTWYKFVPHACSLTFFCSFSFCRSVVQGLRSPAEITPVLQPLCSALPKSAMSVNKKFFIGKRYFICLKYIHEARKSEFKSRPCQSNMASKSVLKQLACRRIKSLFIGRIKHQNTSVLMLKR